MLCLLLLIHDAVLIVVVGLLLLLLWVLVLCLTLLLVVLALGCHLQARELQMVHVDGDLSDGVADLDHSKALRL